MNTVILDPGHGRETPGKCSPDSRVKEWEFNRLLCSELAELLHEHAMEPLVLVAGESDVPLKKRVARANRLSIFHPRVVLLSLHLNAASNDGQWHSPSGFTAYVAQNASANSRRLASLLTIEAREAGVRGNRLASEPYKVQSLAMCRDTHCPAVLTESQFMDNHHDVDFLMSPNSIHLLGCLHLKALQRYFSENA